MSSRRARAAMKRASSSSSYSASDGTGLSGIDVSSMVMRMGSLSDI